MSRTRMTLTVLCTQLAEAVAKDEEPEVGGFDLSAGMFGPNVSSWLREVAANLAAPPESVLTEAQRICSVLDDGVAILPGCALHKMLRDALKEVR